MQGFVRNTLRAGRCDLVMGTVAGDELMQNTNPYYHTSYVIAFRSDRPVPDRLDDPAMKALRLGAIARTPPIDLLLRNGLIGNARSSRWRWTPATKAPAPTCCARWLMASSTRRLSGAPIAGYQAKVEGPAAGAARPAERAGAARMDFRITMGVRGQEPGMAPPHQRGHPRATRPE